jgi:hypothetical protein
VDVYFLRSKERRRGLDVDPTESRRQAMKSQLVGVVALVGATAGLSVGCAAQAQVSGSAEAEAPVVFVGTPTLIEVDSGIWVVRDSDQATYYVDDYYWVYRDGVWYRSRAYDGGWIVVEVSIVPGTIVTRRHAMYVHYHGDARAQVRSAPRGDGPREHDERPGVGNERKAEGEQPGNAHGEGPAKTDDANAAVNEHKGEGAASAHEDKREDKKDDKKDDKKEGKKDGKKKNK